MFTCKYISVYIQQIIAYYVSIILDTALCLRYRILNIHDVLGTGSPLSDNEQCPVLYWYNESIFVTNIHVHTNVKDFIKWILVGRDKSSYQTRV